MIATAPRRTLTIAQFQEPRMSTNGVATKEPAPRRPAPAPRRTDRPQRPGKVLDAIKDAPPEFRWIPKAQLTVDPEYQRDANQTKVERIARGWSWRAFGAMHVAFRADGRYRVFEGGHRYLSACKRDDIDSLPCLIYPSAGARDEAASFLTVNTRRTPLTSLDRFKAQCVDQQDEAILAKQLLDEAGYTLSTSPDEGKRQTKAVGSLIKYLRRNREAMLRVWPLVVEIAAGGVIHQRVIVACFYVEHHLSGTGKSLSQEPYRSKLVRAGSLGILNKTAQLAAYEGKGGDRVWGDALVDLINQGARSNRLTLPTGKGKAARDEAEGPAYETFTNRGGNAIPPGVCCVGCDRELAEADQYVRSVDADGEPGRDFWCVQCTPGMAIS